MPNDDQRPGIDWGKYQTLAIDRRQDGILLITIAEPDGCPPASLTRRHPEVSPQSPSGSTAAGGSRTSRLPDPRRPAGWYSRVGAYRRCGRPRCADLPHLRPPC